MNADRVLSGLQKVKPNGPDRWLACCPAHDDRTPSLSVKDWGPRVTVHCFAGCSGEAIVAALGLTFDDLKANPDDDWKSRSKQKRDASQAFRDAFVLEQCQDMRERGERLSETDLKREREAFQRQRRTV